MSKNEANKKLRQGVQGTGGKIGENEGKAKSGHMDLGHGEQKPETALTLVAENEELRRQLKERDKEIKRLNEFNEFLEEASAFFAASRRKSGRGND